MLNASFFSTNRQNLRLQLKSKGLIIITANGLMQRNNDSAFAFRQDSNFFYLTGLEDANLILVMDTETKEEFLILPNLTEVEVFFGGSAELAELSRISGIHTILTQKEGWERVRKLSKKHTKLYTLLAPPVQLTRQERMFTSPARRLLVQKLKRVTKLPIEGLHSELTIQRSVKQNVEIEAIQKAIEITKAGLDRVHETVRAGLFEYEAEAELDFEFKRRNSKHGYAPPIIASGSNTTILHYQKNNAQLKANDLLLMDVGAESQNYTADISRTYAISGRFTTRQKDVFSAVQRVHREALHLLKPGVLWRDYMIEIDRIMGEELLKLKLITANVREQVRPYFPHSIGHSLGLDVHDPCDYTMPMQESMVVAIEPGIYIPNEGIGVRIEDDIVITKNGSLNISKDIRY